MITIIELQSTLQKLKNRRVSYTEIGYALGTGRSNISKRVSEGSKIKDYELVKIEQYFNVDFGKQTAVNNQIEISDTDPKIKADYYPDVFGSCGGGAFVLSETKEQIEIPLKCFKKPFNKVKKYSVINAYGSSMQPFIFDSDKLIIEHSETGAVIQDDKVYVFAYDNQIFIKRLYYNVDEIIVKSDNPDPIFKVKYISKEQMDDFILIGQVVGIMRDCR